MAGTHEGGEEKPEKVEEVKPEAKKDAKGKKKKETKAVNPALLIKKKLEEQQQFE